MSSKWRKFRLEEQCERVTKGTTPTTVGGRFTESGINFIKVESIGNDGQIQEDKLAAIDTETDELLKRSRILSGDILFTIAGTIGRVSLFPEKLLPANTNQAVAIIRLENNSEIDRTYLYYALRSEVTKNTVAAGVVQAVQANFSLGSIKKLEIQAPSSIDEQRKIAKNLKALDDKIHLNHQINQTLEQMAHAIFKSWFVDFEPVKAKIAALEAGGSEEDTLLAAMQAISGKGEAELTRLQTEQPEQYAELRATAELFPSAMQDSELGEIPEGWRQRQVGELATIKGGKQRSRDLISNIGQVPVFGGAGIMGYTDEHNADGFVISVGRVGAYCGQFFSHRGPSWINNNASLIRPSNINHGEWLFIALQNIDLAPIKKGAAQPFVSNSDLAKLHVVWPGDMVIEKLTQQLRNLSLLQETLLQQSDSLSTFRDTLLPELLAGRLDTSGIGS